MKNYNELEWYVLLYYNEELRRYNIFNNANVHRMLEIALKKYDNFINFKKELCNIFKCAYWSKSEYEIIVTGLFEKDEVKIDVWYQIEKNIDIIARYIINTYNKKKRKKIIIVE